MALYHILGFYPQQVSIRTVFLCYTYSMHLLKDSPQPTTNELKKSHLTLNGTLQAFTLVELLVVISIITLLSSIVFSNVQAARERAADIAAQVNAKNATTAAYTKGIISLSSSNFANASSGASGLYVQNGDNAAGFNEMAADIGLVPNNSERPLAITIFDWNQDGAINTNVDEVVILSLMDVAQNNKDESTVNTSEGKTLSRYLLAALHENSFNNFRMEYCQPIINPDEVDPTDDTLYRFFLNNGSSNHRYMLLGYAPFSDSGPEGNTAYDLLRFKNVNIYKSSTSGGFAVSYINNNPAITDGDASYLYKAAQTKVFPNTMIENFAETFSQPCQTDANTVLRKNIFKK